MLIGVEAIVAGRTSWVGAVMNGDVPAGAVVPGVPARAGRRELPVEWMAS